MTGAASNRLTTVSKLHEAYHFFYCFSLCTYICMVIEKDEEELSLLGPPPGAGAAARGGGKWGGRGANSAFSLFR